MGPQPALPRVLLERGGLGQRTGPVAELLDAGRTQAVAVAVAPATGADGDLQPRPGTADAATRYGVDLFAWARREGLTGAAGESGVLHLPRVLAGHADPPWAGLPDRVVLVGVGDAGPGALRRAGAALARATEGLDQVVTTTAAGTGLEATRSFVEGFLLACYRPPRTGTRPAPAGPPGRLVLVGPHSEQAVCLAVRAAGATWMARRLSATPSNVKNPGWLAERAQEAAASVVGTTVAVRDEDWLADHGFGGLLAVGAGSVTPPRLVVVDYAPALRAPTSRHAVLVGKGITFDTGGLSVKGREAMVPMKTDMAGAAAALAATLAAAEAGSAHRVTAVLPLAENALGGSSYRPGDVVRLVDGTTVEVRNTDAEGRLVLADALAWARADLDPDVLVDIATLTGAATVGLGRRHAALFATDDRLADALVSAGRATGESAWPMPLVEDYRAALDTPVADLANVATDPLARAGSILAALFLRHVVGSTPWAHLDIAGPARAARTEHEVTEGPSGFGARLLLRWLEDLA